MIYLLPIHLNDVAKKPAILKKKWFCFLATGTILQITHLVGSNTLFSSCKERLCYCLKIIFHR